MNIIELRKRILAISQIGLLGAFPIFAAAKILDPYLEPKGRWKFAAAALSRDERIINRLKQIGNPFDKSRLDSNREYQTLVNDIVSALRDMSFEVFLRSVFPDIVPNLDYLAEILQNCSFLKTEYAAYAVMEARLEWTQSEAKAVYSSSRNAREKAKSIVSSQTDWETFKHYVNRYPLKYKQKIGNNALKIAEVFKRHQLPFRAKIRLFCDLYENLKATGSASQPVVVGESLTESKGIILWNVQKAAEEASAHIATIKQPTSAFKELWTESPEDDDSKMEIDFFFRKILVSAHLQSPVLVVNPSPDLLEQAHEQDVLSKITFAMPFAEMIPLLKSQFPSALFVSFDDLNAANSGAEHYGCAWLLNQGLKQSELEPLIERIYDLLQNHGKFYAVLPNSFVTYREESGQSIVHRAFSWERIDVFGVNTFASSPQKRVLVHLVKAANKREEIALYKYNISSHEDTRFLFLDKRSQATIARDQLMTTKSVKDLLRDALHKPAKHRNPPREISFLPDISVQVNVWEIKEQENFYRARGYVSLLPTEKQLKRNVQAHGKKLKDSEIESPI